MSHEKFLQDISKYTNTSEPLVHNIVFTQAPKLGSLIVDLALSMQFKTRQAIADELFRLGYRNSRKKPFRANDVCAVLLKYNDSLFRIVEYNSRDNGRSKGDIQAESVDNPATTEYVELYESKHPTMKEAVEDLAEAVGNLEVTIETLKTQVTEEPAKPFWDHEVPVKLTFWQRVVRFINGLFS